MREMSTVMPTAKRMYRLFLLKLLLLNLKCYPLMKNYDINKLLLVEQHIYVHIFAAVCVVEMVSVI